MKLIPCEDSIEQVKKNFTQNKNVDNIPVVNTNPRSFGNSYNSPRFSIPIPDLKLNQTNPTTTLAGVNIISTSESAVDQAKAEISQQSRPKQIISEDHPDNINILQPSATFQSRPRKRKSTQQIGQSVSKKSKPVQSGKKENKYFNYILKWQITG